MSCFVVVFIWIPSHAGIEGNELLDSAARQASRDENIDLPFVLYDDLLDLSNKTL